MNDDFMNIPEHYVFLEIHVISIDTGCVIGKYTNRIYTGTYRNALSQLKKYKKRIGKKVSYHSGNPCILNDVYICSYLNGEVIKYETKV